VIFQICSNILLRVILISDVKSGGLHSRCCDVELFATTKKKADALKK
jgi:hypothetical protein